MTWWAVGLFHCVRSFHHTVVIIYNWWTSSSLSLLLKWPEPSNPNLQFQEIQVECHPPRLFGKLWMSPDGLSLCKWAPAPLIDSFIDLNLRWIWRVSNHFKNQKQKSTGRNDRINRYQKRFHSIAYSNDYYCCCCCCCCCCCGGGGGRGRILIDILLLNGNAAARYGEHGHADEPSSVGAVACVRRHAGGQSGRRHPPGFLLLGRWKRSQGNIICVCVCVSLCVCFSINKLFSFTGGRGKRNGGGGLGYYYYRLIALILSGYFCSPGTVAGRIHFSSIYSFISRSDRSID